MYKSLTMQWKKISIRFISYYIIRRQKFLSFETRGCAATLLASTDLIILNLSFTGLWNTQIQSGRIIIDNSRYPVRDTEHSFPPLTSPEISRDRNFHILSVNEEARNVIQDFPFPVIFQTERDLSESVVILRVPTRDRETRHHASYLDLLELRPASSFWRCEHDRLGIIS